MARNGSALFIADNDNLVYDKKGKPLPTTGLSREPACAFSSSTRARLRFRRNLLQTLST